MPFPFKENLTLDGRCDRTTWWSVSIGMAILSALFFALIILAIANAPASILKLSLVLVAILELFCIWIVIAITVRRFRDIGLSPWFTFLYLIPHFGWILVLIPCGCLPSKDAPRKKTVTRRRTVNSKQQNPPPNPGS
ncbi:MAG: DUF805 domain-containing protein [Verrucomicrobiaceae bacterium]